MNIEDKKKIIEDNKDIAYKRALAEGKVCLDDLKACNLTKLEEVLVDIVVSNYFVYRKLDKDKMVTALLTELHALLEEPLVDNKKEFMHSVLNNLVTNLENYERIENEVSKKSN